MNNCEISLVRDGVCPPCLPKNECLVERALTDIESHVPQILSPEQAKDAAKFIIERSQTRPLPLPPCTVIRRRLEASVL